MSRSPSHFRPGRAPDAMARVRARARTAARMLACLLLVSPAMAQVWTQARPAARYDRAHLPDPASAARIQAAGHLAGTGECCVTGWLEYDFDVPRAGWYELSVAGSGGQIEYLINAGGTGVPWRAFDSSGNVVDGLDKIGNFWLDAGRNAVRLQRYYWSGFPRVSQIVLRAAPATLAGSARASLAGSYTVFRAGECAPLQIHAGALAAPATLVAEVRDVSGRLLASHEWKLPAGGALRSESVTLPCNEEGEFLVSWRDKTAGWLAWRDVRGITYQVIARKAPEPVPSQRRLVRDIDMTSQAPDYTGGGGSRMVKHAAGNYRESGSTGFTRYQRAPRTLRAAMPEPSWFAYAVDGLVPQALHEIEVDYPDDAERSVVIALREPSTLSYPVSSGFDTGGEFASSGRMQRHTLVFWPRSDKLRVVIMNVHDGRHAAAARLRIYRRDSLDAPPLIAGGRQVLQWYEEGANFQSVVGTPDAPRYEWRAQPRRIGAGRWAQLAAHGGATVLSPTVAIYSFGLHPSEFNRAFSVPEGEDLRHILLAAEKSGLKVIPELHPRADELDWPFATGGHPRPNLLLSRQGRSNYFQDDGRTRSLPPHYNPIHPANQAWYLGLIEELVRQHRDSPALQGVSLRLMPWANASLNNFVSLHWGYDDYSITRFAQETHTPVPPALLGAAGTHPELAAARHAWLLRHARDAWITWRCRQITALYARIRDTLRAARPDLRLYTTIFTWQEDAPDAQALREAGIDVDSLRALEGVEVIDARGTYGRREPDAQSNRRRRERLLAPPPLGTSAALPSALLSTASYVEATETIVPPERIGYAPGTRHTWVSAGMTPGGHHILERYAVQLARADPLLLGDGGNGYAIGQPILHEWLREFRALPARPFTTFAPAVGPVTVRWLEHGARWFGYVVNRIDSPVALNLSFNADVRLSRLVDGHPLPAPDGRLSLTLAPYQLIVLSAPRGTRLLAADASSPSASSPQARAR